MRSEGYCSWVCLAVCHGASVRPENAVTYILSGQVQNICGVFSETDALQRSSTPSVVLVARARPSRKERGSGDTRIVKLCRVAKVAVNYTHL